MYANEILFVDKFLSELKIMGAVSIPFRTKEYRDGILAMKDYYERHEDELGEGLEDISLLFLRGGNKDFADAIMMANGGRISLKNPCLEVATIQMSDERARIAVNDGELNISNIFLSGITQVFCEAAHVEFR